MTDRRSGEKSLRELEFNNLNIHLYLTLNYGTASEHLDFDFMVLYNVFVLSWGLTITPNSICTISDLDRPRLTDTRSAENASIGADTDPEYRIDASLLHTTQVLLYIITVHLATCSVRGRNTCAYRFKGALTHCALFKSRYITRKWPQCFLHLQVSLPAFLISQVDGANHKHLRSDKNRGKRKEWRMENKNNMVRRWYLWHPVSLKMDNRGEMDTTSPSVRGERQRQMRREMCICQHVHKPLSLWRPTSTFSLPSLLLSTI